LGSTFSAAPTAAAGLRPLAAITDKATARKILEHLGLPADAVTARPRAREAAEVWADTPAAPP
jgi:hypothetical protein